MKLLFDSWKPFRFTNRVFAVSPQIFLFEIYNGLHHENHSIYEMFVPSIQLEKCLECYQTFPEMFNSDKGILFI